jgi:hypothetical protein
MAASPQVCYGFVESPNCIENWYFHQTTERLEVAQIRILRDQERQCPIMKHTILLIYGDTHFSEVAAIRSNVHRLGQLHAADLYSPSK